MIKTDAIKVISEMDDNVTMDDIMYRLYILGKYEKATEDIRNGRLYTSSEVREALKSGR